MYIIFFRYYTDSIVNPSIDKYNECYLGGCVTEHALKMDVLVPKLAMGMHVMNKLIRKLISPDKSVVFEEEIGYQAVQQAHYFLTYAHSQKNILIQVSCILHFEIRHGPPPLFHIFLSGPPQFPEQLGDPPQKFLFVILSYDIGHPLPHFTNFRKVG